MFDVGKANYTHSCSWNPCHPGPTGVGDAEWRIIDGASQSLASKLLHIGDSIDQESPQALHSFPKLHKTHCFGKVCKSRKNASTNHPAKSAAGSKKKTTAAARKPPAKSRAGKKVAAKQIQSDREMSDAEIEVGIGEDDEEQLQETQGEPELTQAEEPGASQGKKGGKRAVASRPGVVKAGTAAGDFCQTLKPKILTGPCYRAVHPL